MSQPKNTKTDKVEELNEFFKTLKVHNKDITACFYDALAVRHIKELIKESLFQTQQDTLEWCLDEVVGICGTDILNPINALKSKQRQTIKKKMGGKE